MLTRQSIQQWLFLGATLIAAVVATASSARAQSNSELLAEARRLFEIAKYDEAVALLDRSVLSLEARAAQEPAVRLDLLTAYELRVRVQFNQGNQPAAEEDLARLFRYKPDYHIPPDVSPKLIALFESTRRYSVGEVILNVTPENADVALDGDPLTIRSGTLALVAGAHTIAARRPGFKTFNQNITVVAGETQPLSIEMERNAATVSIVTSPSGVEVILNGVSRGTTQQGEASPGTTEVARRLSIDASTVSAPMVLSDLGLGNYTLEYRRPCFRDSEQRFTVGRLADFTADPIKLIPAVGTIQVDTVSAGATIYLDETRRSQAPAILADVCEGSHTLEVRSAYGRYVSRFDLQPGEKRAIDAVLKPAFAILSKSGTDDSIRGAQDIRVLVEQKLANAADITVFAPPSDRADQALRSANLTQGWLAFDRLKRPMDEAAKITPSARRQYSTQLARSVEAQGIAAITTEGGANPQSEVLISLLAAGSSEPDVYSVRIEDAESVRRLLETLDIDVPLYRPTIGILLMDVQGVPGPIVASVDANSALTGTIASGDLIVSANGRPIQDTGALESLLRTLKADEKLSLVLKGKDAAEKRAEVGVTRLPRAISVTNQTLPFNQLLLMLRQRLAAAEDPLAEPVIRLNIGIALMHLENFEDARSELERVKLGDGSGVSNGTVQYLLGLCYEKLGLFDQAGRAWVQASMSEGWLTEEGPLVKTLAAAKLAPPTR